MINLSDLVTLLNDRLIEFGQVENIEANTSTFASKEEVLDIELRLNRPLSYMSYSDMRKRGYKDEWLMHKTYSSSEVELECPRCGKFHSVSISNLESYRFCCSCGTKLCISDDDYEDLTTSVDNKDASNALDNLINGVQNVNVIPTLNNYSGAILHTTATIPPYLANNVVCNTSDITYTTTVSNVSYGGGKSYGV